MIDDVVPMHRAGARFENRRGIDIGDAEFAKILKEIPSVGETEVLMKL
jgi:hypothetical protein